VPAFSPAPPVRETLRRREFTRRAALADPLGSGNASVSDVPIISRKVSKLEEDVAILKTDVATIKAIVTDHSATLNWHDREIQELQAKVG
jgi:hypothetical protein